MSIKHFHIEADGAVFEASADVKTGDISIRIGERPDERFIYMSRNTAEVLARGLIGLAQEGEQ